jgi:hypothetical protein
MSYLLIQSKGEAPIEAFTVLGLSGSRNSSVKGTIGQFGSGTKHAINLLLRKGIPFRIYSGKTRLHFFTKPSTVNDSVDTVESNRVYCKLSGTSTRTIECGWDVEFGALDWDKVSMALREFVSNAIDITNRSEDPTREYDLCVEVVEDAKAKSGYTRIYVDSSHPAVAGFYGHLDHHFLYFSARPQQTEQKFLRKTDALGPKIYREGVFIRRLDSKSPSAFDYNFRKDEIEIDECRNSSEYALRAQIAKAINKAPAGVLCQLFEKMNEGLIYECGLDTFYLSYCESGDTENNWIDGWELYAEGAVAASSDDGFQKEYAEKKGHKVKGLKSSAFYSAARSMGIKTLSSVLGDREMAGVTECNPSEESCQVLDAIWERVDICNLTDGQEKPEIVGFRMTQDAENDAADDDGHYTIGQDYIEVHEDLGGDRLRETVMLLVAQWVTVGGPQSASVRDFLVKFALKGIE